ATVVRSSDGRGGDVVRRLRRCDTCDADFYTYEDRATDRYDDDPDDAHLDDARFHLKRAIPSGDDDPHE
ncbi:MAG: hypothetical protein ABEN55_20290, partial [Bradymonadaceae bacterium]